MTVKFFMYVFIMSLISIKSVLANDDKVILSEEALSKRKIPMRDPSKETVGVTARGSDATKRREYYTWSSPDGRFMISVPVKSKK